MRRCPLTLSLLLAVSACELVEPNFFASDPPDPACQVEDADVTGNWIIEGQGERLDCDDDTFDTSKFELNSRLDLPVTQTDGTLELDRRNLSSAFASFAFSGGSVMGRCVAFRTVEETAFGPVDLMWEGVVSENGGLLTGQFSGTGPSNCETRGDFRIDVR